MRLISIVVMHGPCKSERMVRFHHEAPIVAGSTPVTGSIDVLYMLPG